MGQLEGIVDRFEGRRLLVVGDVILDRFIWGHVKRISPEAPVPVVEVERISDHLGGAANVAVNLARLGARVSLLGVVGSDAAGRKVVRKLGELGIEASGVVLDESRATTLKSRVIAQHQQVCRTDRENREPLNEGPLDRLLESLADSVKLAEGVILSDYAKGVVGSELTRAVIEGAKASGKFVSVDPKGTDFAKYRGATVITPNQAEFEAAAAGDLPADRTDWPAAADSLMERTGNSPGGAVGASQMDPDQTTPHHCLSRTSAPGCALQSVLRHTGHEELSQEHLHGIDPRRIGL